VVVKMMYFKYRKTKRFIKNDLNGKENTMPYEFNEVENNFLRLLPEQYKPKDPDFIELLREYGAEGEKAAQKMIRADKVDEEKLELTYLGKVK